MSEAPTRERTGPVSVARRGDVAVITVTNPPVNAISRAVRAGLLDAFRSLAADSSVTAVVISGRPGRFIAGADIREMNSAPEPPHLPEVVAAIEALDVPVVAAIDGAALGGGLEIALACDCRLATPSATLGLTETRLGIVPGAGGTQRLPRLTGIAAAIRLIGEGKILIAREALKSGILDDIMETDLLSAACALAPSIAKRRLSAMGVAPGGDEVDAAIAEVIRRAKGLPAAARAVELIQATADTPFAAGLGRERAAFLELREGPEAKALRHLFFAEREAAKVPGLDGVTARPLGNLAVIGGGTMGAGIAAALADAGLPVTLIERDADAAASATARLHGLYERQVAGGRLARAEVETRLMRITASADWSALADVDLVIEAVFEDIAVKTDVFRRLDETARPGAVLATNTSYLDLDAIAAATCRPGDVIGLHFFAPANVMKLLEIVRGAATAPDVVATALALARRMGKQPVVAHNGDGFIGNRIFAVYRRHAEYLIEDGASPVEVDAALEAYGFAMGIFAVSDLSGLDIALAMRRRRDATRSPDERYVDIADRLCAAGRLGRKTGAGWYAYGADGRKRPDPAVADMLAAARAEKGITPRRFTAQEIQRRLVAVMANEGARVLADGIALRASDIDLAFVHGYGFPRLKGGPMWAADRIGLATILAEIEAAHRAGGAGSEPAKLLIDLARRNATFSDWRP
ncbi:3-hydroxyacyl-CoA dehydrogenase NAD-binding domain-containing protein [Xanthobacteraceae bacterium Astr-EGSB]|uniref:FAD-dependent oxidoreductase n=1 Tax=Astrobacterium formosum TaxID=3069710 RepID=UPI0027B4910F|nr:3-hydroxyacyl-CoA dehydrogenase NAD-binding domain-containing protein [Xanthobacteraceae bacterium Astr-EGSB]